MGMLIGIGVAALNFMLSYVQVPVMAPECSHETQDVVERMVVSKQRGTIAHFEFRGYLFFASVVQIVEGVQKGVYIRKVTDKQSCLPTHASTIECLDGSPAPNSNAFPTEYVVMDFTRVPGMDATAARGAFLILKKYCRNHGITTVFANVLPEIHKLLLKNDIVSKEGFYPSADAVLSFCGKHVSTYVEEKNTPRTQHRSHNIEPISLLLQRLMSEPDHSQSLECIDQFFRKRVVPVGYEFYDVAQYSNCFYLLATGQVSISVDEVSPNQPLKTILPGSMFGEVTFFTWQRRHSAATAVEPCTVFEMTRKQFNAMQHEDPTLAIRLRDVVVQSMALSITNLTLGSSSLSSE